MPDDVARILLISGSTRSQSTNTTALRTIAEHLPAGIESLWAPALESLPAFNPDDDHPPLPPAVAALRDAVATADAVLFCVPEYAGTVPGALKNLLDWCVGGTEFGAKPTAWLQVGAPGRGDGAAQTMALVLGYLGAAVVADACRTVDVRRYVGADGGIDDPDGIAALIDVAVELRDAARPATPS